MGDPLLHTTNVVLIFCFFNRFYNKFLTRNVTGESNIDPQRPQNKLIFNWFRKIKNGICHLIVFLPARIETFSVITGQP